MQDSYVASPQENSRVFWSGVPASLTLLLRLFTRGFSQSGDILCS